jgi:signal transduction histidine kinase
VVDRGYVVHDKTGKPIRMIGAMVDITARKRAEQELRASREQLRALAGHLETAREQERTRMARELHEEIGQVLTAIKLTLEMSTSGRLSPTQEGLAQALGLLNELIDRVQNLSLELRPALLDHLGLLPVLTWHFQRYTAQLKIEVDFRHAGLEGRRVDPEVETAAYRIVEEALDNVARYGKSRRVEVEVGLNENTLGISIRDPDTGFDGAAVERNGDGGFSGMQERALALGGRLDVGSAAGAGMLLAANLPFKRSSPGARQAAGSHLLAVGSET